MNLDDKVIVACASGSQSHAAISIIRLSGKNFLSQISTFFINKSFKPFKMTRSRYVVSGVDWDDLCYCFFPSPKSYTGEDVLELYVHGNILNVRRFLDHLSSLPDFRLALPGEFTRRALSNNKLTLSQAEGLDLFLNANSPIALSQGISLMHGELHHLYLELFESFKRHKASLELLLDFHEDVGEEQARENLNQSWLDFESKITHLYNRTRVDSSSLLRPEIVVAGLPNAGKSTFFNLVLGENRAIVTSIAGTTRDYLSEDFSFKNVIYRLTDTAGIRTTNDEIESEGIKRGLSRLGHSFFSILLINPFESDPTGLKDLLSKNFDLVLLTHSDRLDFHKAIQDLEKASGLVLSGHTQISLLKDNNINDLLDFVNKKYLTLNTGDPILQDRQRQVLSKTYNLSCSYRGILANESDIGILSHELNALAHCLEDLLGLVSPDEVLDHIFANFCIGK